MSDDPYQSRNEGQFGMPLSPGGDFNEWAIGRSIADQNRRELERQNEVSAQAYAPTAGSMPMPTPSFPGYAGTGGGGGGAAVTGSPAAAVGGCLALIVAVPLYSITLPLWICAYPAAAVAAGAAGTAVISFMGNGDATITPLGRLMAGGAVAFIVGWGATLADRRLGRRSKPYWVVRHLLRLALFAVYAYALTLRLVGVGRLPTTRPTLSNLTWNPEQIAIVLVTVVAAHLLLTKVGWFRDR